MNQAGKSLWFRGWLLCCAVLCCAVLCCAVLCYAVLCIVAQSCARVCVLCGVVVWCVFCAVCAVCAVLCVQCVLCCVLQPKRRQSESRQMYLFLVWTGPTSFKIYLGYLKKILVSQILLFCWQTLLLILSNIFLFFL